MLRTVRKPAIAGLAAVLAGGILTLPSGAVAADPALDPLVTTAGTTWKYLDDGSLPGGDPLAWTSPAFDDAAWKSATGSFGGKVEGTTESPVYATGKTATTRLPMNLAGTTDRVPSYLFRTEVTLTAADLAKVSRVVGSMDSDDGALVYVNGTEVLRADVPAGTTPGQYADVSDTDLDTNAISFGADLLHEGENTIAVAVFNQRATSSDVWFDLTELKALTPAEAAAQPTRVILTPTETPETSQAITFQGAEADDSTAKVEIKPAAGGASRIVKAYLQPQSASNDFPHFSTVVSGLKPATDYTYRVASDGAWSDWATFGTADPDEKEFSYVYYGDAQIGLDTTWPSVVAQAQEKAPDSIGSVHAGDLINTANNDTEWANWFKGMRTAAATTNVFAAPGNHEYSGDKLMTSWKAHFEYPSNNPNDSTIGDMAKLADGDTDAARQYRAYFDHWSEFAAETVYFADYQGVRFITINATRDTTFLTPDDLPACAGADCPSTAVDRLWTQYQAAWLDHVLTESPSKWNVVTFHQPVYSGSEGRDEPILREYWVPVFEKHDVDLVQMGHDHVYSRGYKNTTATSTPGVTAGPVYIVSNSGAKHYDLETDEKNVWTNNGATQVQKGEDFTTYQVVDVTEDTLTYTSYIAEVTPTATWFKNGTKVATPYQVGDVWDRFTVHKTDAGTKAVVEDGVTPPVLEQPDAAPVIAGQPKDVRAKAGDTVRLSVSATATKPLTYQWQRRSGRGAWVDLTGQKGASLDLPRVTLAENSRRYRVVVTAGTRSTVSREVALKVTQRASSVRIGAVTAKRGKAVKVTVRPSVDGTVKVRVKLGRTTLTKVLKARGGRTTTVVLPRLSKKAAGRASVTVSLDAAGSVYADSSARTSVAVRR